MCQSVDGAQERQADRGRVAGDVRNDASGSEIQRPALLRTEKWKMKKKK